MQILAGGNAPHLAAHALAAGSLVIIPTETVYGLGADAENTEAVARVFQVKGRPTDHPLIVHIASAECVNAWALDIPDYARDLAVAYWPGPMTLVLNRSSKAQNFITGGQQTVALRVPAHPLTREVIAKLGEVKDDKCAGVAAPSANRFGKVSPTTLEHAVDELGDVIDQNDLGIDGGQCDIGIESTIIDCTGPQPIIVRRGAITESDVEKIAQLSEDESKVRAPGMLASHYAPQAKVRVVQSTSELTHSSSQTGLLALDEIDTPAHVIRLGAPADVNDYAKVLYSSLRKGDDQHCELIYVIPPQGPGLAAAIRDRIARASTPD